MVKPMIQRVYERAAQARGVERVLVATDDARIRDAVERLRRRGGDDASRRIAPAPIASPRWPATLDAEVIVNVQGDLPLLDPAMVGAAVAPLLADGGLPMATIKHADSRAARNATTRTS